MSDEPELPPDVRDRAAWAAVRAVKPPLPGAISFEVATAVVDAVAEVLAAEQPDALAKAEIAYQGQVLIERLLRRERDALHARVEQLTAALTEIVETNDPNGFNAAYNPARAALAAAVEESQ